MRVLDDLVNLTLNGTLDHSDSAKSLGNGSYYQSHSLIFGSGTAFLLLA